MKMVSVCMITYNHQDYIIDALESILNQKCSFDFEIVLSNDCSSDKTDEIISEFIKENKLSNRIKYFNHKDNLGITPNFIFSIKKCKGKYIAICEGDDYWIDENKLQKQVDFLEHNEDFTGVATNSMVKYQDTDKEHLFRTELNSIYETNDLLEARHFHTATFMFRSETFMHDFPTNVLSADRTLFMLVSSYGKMKMSEDVTAVYRKNDGGISRRVTSKQIKRDYLITDYIKRYKKDFDENKLNSFIAKTILEYSFKIYFYDFIKASLYHIYYKYKGEKSLKKKIRSLFYSFKTIKKFMYKIKF